ncbi:MAG: hypothetical protein CfClM3_0996 [Methanobrevibacter sp. CfCl-M3]
MDLNYTKQLATLAVQISETNDVKEFITDLGTIEQGTELSLFKVGDVVAFDGLGFNDEIFKVKKATDTDVILGVIATVPRWNEKYFKCDIKLHGLIFEAYSETDINIGSMVDYDLNNTNGVVNGYNLPLIKAGSEFQVLDKDTNIYTCYKNTVNCGTGSGGGTTYTAGNGISIDTNNVIAANTQSTVSNTNKIATISDVNTYTAGNGISITTNNKIDTLTQSTVTNTNKIATMGDLIDGGIPKFYLAYDGDNNNDGLSEATPVQTLSRILNVRATAGFPPEYIIMCKSQGKSNPINTHQTPTSSLSFGNETIIFKPYDTNSAQIMFNLNTSSVATGINLLYNTKVKWDGILAFLMPNTPNNAQFNFLRMAESCVIDGDTLNVYNNCVSTVSMAWFMFTNTVYFKLRRLDFYTEAQYQPISFFKYTEGGNVIDINYMGTIPENGQFVSTDSTGKINWLIRTSISVPAAFISGGGVNFDSVAGNKGYVANIWSDWSV